MKASSLAHSHLLGKGAFFCQSQQCPWETFIGFFGQESHSQGSRLFQKAPSLVLFYVQGKPLLIPQSGRVHSTPILDKKFIYRHCLAKYLLNFFNPLCLYWVQDKGYKPCYAVSLSFFSFYWNVVDLQCCVSLRYIAK